MSRETILARIAEILHDNFSIEPGRVKPDATFRGTFGLDSLDVVDLVFFVQKAFDFKAELHDFRNVATVKDLVELLVERGIEA